MKKMRFAIIGLGRLGLKCVEAIFADQDTEYAGHASFLLEARFDEAGLAARMMVAAAQSLITPRRVLIPY